MQTSVSETLPAAVPGLVSDSIYNTWLKSGVASEEIPFGLAVVLDKDKVDASDRDMARPTGIADIARLLGVAAYRSGHEQVEGQTYDSYPQYEQMRFLAKGQIWVKSADEIDDLSKGVYVRHTCAAETLPNTARGTFRATRDSGQVFTLTCTDPDASWSFYLKNKTTGALHLISGTDPADNDAFASAIQTIIDALTGISASVAANVVTCTAGNFDEEWLISDDLGTDVVFADTTVAEYAKWQGSRWIAAKTIGSDYYGLLLIP